MREARIATEKTKDGKTVVTVLDRDSGQVVSQHQTGCGDSDVRSMKNALERKGIRTDVVEH